MAPNTGAGGLPRRRPEEQRGAGLVAQPHSGGRWPANLIHDGSEEVVRAFPDEAGAAAPVHRRNGDKFRNSFGTFHGNTDEKGSTFQGDTGSAARFFYCPKTSRADRNEGCDELPQVAGGMVSNTSGQHLTRRDGYVPPPQGNNHPTVKPTELMAYLCRLATPPGGLVLDPFMGSGSTGKAAMREGFRFVGCELSPEYLAIAQARITHEVERVAIAATEAAATAAQLDIFNDSKVIAS
ncbi:DNA methylase [compost metagenome]